MSLDVLLTRRWPERRPVVLTAAVAGFAAIAAASRMADDASLGISALYVLPVMLAALELGLAGGLAAAALTIALVVAGGPGLDVVGIVTSSVAFVTVGAIAGRFSDRMRAAREREQRLLDSGLVLSEVRTGAALTAAVTEAALHTPGAVGAAAAFDGHASAARGRPGRDWTTMPIVARRERVGSLTVVHDAALHPEDRAALQLLALQAGLAADNQQLLAREQEAVALAAQLRRTRDELREHRSELGHMLAEHEDERQQVAEVLHEDLAQALAGVLLGLRMLQREDPDDGLEEVHGQIVTVLDDIRDMATALRPSSLAQLGLVPALEGLARQSDGRLSVQTDRVPDSLPEPLRTGVFRVVQQILAAARAPARLALKGAGEHLDLELDLELDDGDRLATTRAWVAVLGGSMRVEPSGAGRTHLVMHLPLAQAARASVETRSGLAG